LFLCKRLGELLPGRVQSLLVVLSDASDAAVIIANATNFVVLNFNIYVITSTSTPICRRKKRGQHTSNVAGEVLLEQPVEAMTTSTLAGVQNILN